MASAGPTDPRSTLSFQVTSPTVPNASVTGQKAWEPFGTLSIPPEPVKTRLFEGTEIREGGPELSLTMHVGGGRMAPMHEEAQKIYFRAVADAALSCMPEEQCKKIIGFVPFKNGIRFEVSTGKKSPAWEPKWVEFQPPWASEPRADDPLIESNAEEWTSGLGADLADGPEKNLASWVKRESYAPGATKSKDEVVLDLRPRKKYDPEEAKEPQASVGVKRLLYLLMLAHKGVGDGLRTKRPLESLESKDIEATMDDLFNDSPAAKGK